MDSIFNLGIPIAIGLVFLVLLAGVINMLSTKPKARSRSNQLMRLRVVFQFIAIIVIVGALAFREIVI